MRKPDDDSAELLREVIDRVGYVHIKDKKLVEGGRPQTCPIGTGDVNIAGCVEVLKGAKYDGVLSLEVLGVQNPEEQSKAGVEYLKSLLAS